MKKVILAATATQVDKEKKQFNATVTFTNEQGDQIKIGFLYTNPHGNLIDIVVTEPDDSTFHVLGLPVETTLLPFTEKQRSLVHLAMQVIPKAIDCAELFPENVDNDGAMTSSSKPSTSGTHTIEIDEKMHDCIFHEEIEKNMQLEKLLEGLDIPPHLIRKAKYASLPDYCNCTLEEAEHALLLEQPDEENKQDDTEFLKVIKKIIDLKSAAVPA